MRAMVGCDVEREQMRVMVCKAFNIVEVELR